LSKFFKTKRDLALYCDVTRKTLDKYLAMGDCPEPGVRGWNGDKVRAWLRAKIQGNPATQGKPAGLGKGGHKSDASPLDPLEVARAKHKKTVVEYEAKQFDLDLKKGLYIERSKYMSRLHQLGSAVQLPLMQLMIKKQPVKLQMRDAGEIRAENTEDYNKICESMRELFRKWAQEDNADDNGSDDGDVGDGLEAN
jgi:hypothetical protein